MSTVLYVAEGHGMLLSDTRAWQRSVTSPGRKKKLYRLDDRSIIGITSSSPGAPERFVACLNDPELDRTWEPNLNAIRVIGRGRILLYIDSFFPAGPIVSKRHAIGSGGEYAMGALEAGRSGVDAVQIACKLDECSGGPVDVMYRYA